MDEYETIRRMAKFYMEEKKAVHIRLKNKKVYNGLIKEISRYDLILEDRYIGRMIIDFSEIEERIEKYKNIKGEYYGQ